MSSPYSYLPGSPVAPGNHPSALDKRLFVCYIITMTAIKKESIFTVTFTEGGEVFIQAMDESHARRIIENNGLWSRNTEDVPFERAIKKIEKV